VTDALSARLSEGPRFEAYSDACAFLDAGRCAAAIARVWPRYTTWPWAARAAARALVLVGATDEALRLATEGVRRAPGSAPLLALVGDIERLRGVREASERALCAALALAPADEGTRVGLARLLVGAGCADEASRARLDGLSIVPRSSALRCMLAEIELSRDRADPAWEAIAPCVEQGTSGATGQLLVDVAARAGRMEELDRRLEARTAAAAEDTGAALLRADLLARPGRDEERIGILERALDRSPRDPSVCDALADALSAVGRHVEAQTLTRPERWRGSTPLILRDRQAWLLVRSGEREQAIAAMRELLAMAPAYARGWRCLAAWTEERGGPPHVDALRGWAAPEPHDVEPRARLAEALRASGALDESERVRSDLLARSRSP
jgi:predicted Zn-dependent protease